MKITPVQEHGLQLTRMGFINCYLVREDDGYTLIDAGLKGSEAEILAAAQGTPIRRILLTHAHIDHVGSVDAIVARSPGVIVAASQRSVPMLQIPADRSLWPGEEGEIRGATPGIATPVSQPIEEGDRVGSLRVVATPGHIPGQLAFLDERDGTVYAGDALFGVSHLGITGWAPWWFPLNKCWNRRIAKQSVQKLLDYTVQRFACGHGPVREGGKVALEQAIARAKE